jgi:hypothetical protein
MCPAWKSVFILNVMQLYCSKRNFASLLTIVVYLALYCCMLERVAHKEVSLSSHPPPLETGAQHWESMLYTKQTNKKQTPWSESANELYRPNDSRLSAKLLPTFADRGCHVVSVTNPYGRILGVLYRSRYFFLPSTSSIVLTRLSGARSRPTTSENIW